MSVLDPGHSPLGDLVVYEGPFTIADRDAVPDNGYRHELLDGMLVMSAAPRLRHQLVLIALFDVLRDAMPDDLIALVPPFDVRSGPSTAMQPDIVVTRRVDAHEDGYTLRPVLCVEVASPSTRTFDLGRKMKTLAEIGCPTYWTVEPDAPQGPELTVWELRDGCYAQTARVSGHQPFSTATPYPITVVPADLLDG